MQNKSCKKLWCLKKIPNTSYLVQKTETTTENKNEISIISNLVTNGGLNSKATDIEPKIPSITDLVANATFNAQGNKK